MPAPNNKQKTVQSSTQPAKSPITPVAVQTKTKGIDAEPKTKSIFCRPLDLFFAIAYFLFALSQLVVLTVRCAEIVPSSLTTTVCPLVAKLEGPLSLPVHTYQAWGQKVFTAKSTDALNHATTVNVLVLAPIAIILGWSFIRGCGCAKNLALLHAAGLLYSMYMLYSAGSDAIVNGKGKTVKGGDVATFFGAVLGFYFFFPIAVILRVWQDKPFTNEPTAKSGFFIGTLKTIIKLVFFIWLLVAVVAYYEFAVKNVKAAKDLPSVVDATAENWKTIEPHVAEYTQGALDTAVKVSKDAYEQASTIAADLGKQVEDLIAKATKKE